MKVESPAVATSPSAAAKKKAPLSLVILPPKAAAKVASPASQPKDLDNAAAQRGGDRPAWMRSLLDSARTWMGLLPESLNTRRRIVENNRLQNIKDPLYRFFLQETNRGAELLQLVRQDLQDVIEICQQVKFKLLLFFFDG